MLIDDGVNQRLYLEKFCDVFSLQAAKSLLSAIYGRERIIEIFTHLPAHTVSHLNIKDIAIFVYHSIEVEFTTTARVHDDICYRLGLSLSVLLGLWNRD